MERLCYLDPPVADSDGAFPEDVRADSAKRIFAAYWQKLKMRGLDQVRHVSYCIGDTGQFPFAAVTPIVADLAKRESDEAISMFQSTVPYFDRRTEIEAGDEEIVNMLIALDGVIPDGSLLPAVRSAVDRLTKDRGSTTSASKTKTTYKAVTYSKSGNRQYTSAKEMLLIRLLPRIQRLDPSLATKIVKARPTLSGPKDGFKPADRTESVTITRTADESTTAQLQLKGLENGRLREVQRTVTADPRAALSLARTISIPFLRSQALATVANALAEQDPDLAASLLRESRKGLDTSADAPERILAAIPAILAAAKLGDPASVEHLLRTNLDAGIQFWQQEIDLKLLQAALLCRAFEPLMALVQVGSKLDPVWTVAEVRKLDSLQRSYLLIAAAEGVHEISNGK